MVDIRNFKGLMYNSDISGDISLNICPPFDVISSEFQEELYLRSKFNLVRLEFGKENHGDNNILNKYKRASNIINDWRSKNILVNDESCNFYLTEETFFYEKSNHIRTGIMVLVKLEDLNLGSILPHENTTPEPKKDRLKLMIETKCNFSPLMALYRDESGQIIEILENEKISNPELEIDSFEVKLKLWKVKDKGIIEKIKKCVVNKKLMLADGHHRYETALYYKDYVSVGKSSDNSSNFRLMTLFSIDDSGVLILGYHRILVGLTENEKKNLINFLQSVASKVSNVDFAGFSSNFNDYSILIISEHNSKVYSFENSDVYDNQYELLHNYVFKNVFDKERLKEIIDYEHDVSIINQSITDGEIDFGFIMKPLAKNKFEDIVVKRQKLPPKSTFFYPKLQSGLVIQDLDSKVF